MLLATRATPGPEMPGLGVAVRAAFLLTSSTLSSSPVTAKHTTSTASRTAGTASSPAWPDNSPPRHPRRLFTGMIDADCYSVVHASVRIRTSVLHRAGQGSIKEQGGKDEQARWAHCGTSRRLGRDAAHGTERFHDQAQDEGQGGAASRQDPADRGRCHGSKSTRVRGEFTEAKGMGREKVADVEAAMDEIAG